MKTTRYPAKERRALLLEQRKRKEALEKLEICKRAYENKFSKSFDGTEDLWGICEALGEWIFADDDRTVLFRPRDVAVHAICRELSSHVGDQRNTWGLQYSEALGDPWTRAGYQARQRLLRLAIRHYRAVAAGKPGLLHTRH